MLAYVRRDVGVCALGHVVQGFDHKLGLDYRLVVAVVFQAITTTPAFDGFPPTGQRLGVWLLSGFFDHVDHLDQHIFNVAHDWHVNLHALGNTGRIDIDMDDLAFVLREVLGIANHTVVKTGTNGQQYIAMLHGVIGFDGAVHAEHAEKFG